MLFPEFGGQSMFVHQYGRFVCQKHSHGICKPYNVDYSACRLLPGLEGQDISMLMRMVKNDGTPYAVFTRDGDAFQVIESTERTREYPSIMVSDANLGIEYDKNDARSVPLCAWGHMIRYVPQWDVAVVGKDEAAKNKLIANGEVPDKLLPISEMVCYFCETCQVTWQATKMDEDDPLTGHPSHHTWVDRVKGAKRAIIVHVDGAFTQSSTNAPARAGVGVFFGVDSAFNTTKRFERRMLGQDVFSDGRN